MAKFLSQEWLDLVQEIAQELPEQAEASARAQLVVSGAPDGDVRYYAVVHDARLTAIRLGDDSEADFTVSTRYDDSVKIATGKLDANAAFMQGKLKVVGDMGKVMALMPLTQTTAYRAVRTKVEQKTEF